MTDSRRGRGANEPEHAAVTPGSQNHSGKRVNNTTDASTIEGQPDPPDPGPAAWVGRSSESRLRVPPSEAGQPEARSVRKPRPGDIMTRAEVAALLRCSEPHVIALVEREQLPGFRLGRPWRFRRSEVLAWCEKKINGRRSA
ncbi:MAG: helix-turn-helix domain-containing protein [Pseudomonadota bacterium]